MGRTLVANRLLAGSACGKRQRGRPLNAIVRPHVSTALRWAIITGTVVFLAHLAFAIALFVSVHRSSDGQAGFVWFYLMQLDFPVSDFAWKYLATTSPMVALMEWGDSWGNGRNLRALFIHGLIGGAQWFILGALLGLVVWKGREYVVLRRAREV